jgi:hypothetical protein
MLPFQTEIESPGHFPKSVYRLLIVQTEVCRLSVFYEETNGNYLFANGLHGLKGPAHLCLFQGFSAKITAIKKSVDVRKVWKLFSGKNYVRGSYLSCQ